MVCCKKAKLRDKKWRILKKSLLVYAKPQEMPRLCNISTTEPRLNNLHVYNLTHYHNNVTLAE